MRAIHLLTSLASLALVVSSCAASDAADETPGDDTPGTEEGDDPPGEEPGGPGPMTCTGSSHVCGTACIAAAPNEPATGCALGCGEACAVPEHGLATCTAGGKCAATCDPPYALDNGECVLFTCTNAGYACGNYVDDEGTMFGCGTCYGAAACGANHQCVIAPDAQETNNTRTTAKDLGTFDDSDNRTRWVEALSIHRSTDEDWFRFRVKDGFDGNNPDAWISLEHKGTTLGWLSSSHELTVWFKCDGNDGGTTVSCGEWYADDSKNNASDPVLGKGCRASGSYVPFAKFEANCSGTTDSGTVTVRVRKNSAPRGDKYDLYVSVK